MLFIQFLIIAFTLLVISRIILNFKKSKASLRGTLLWLGLWLVVGVIALLPQTTVFLAKILGVSRGTDVAVYFSILFVFLVLFRIIVKLEKIEQEITEIIRHLALKNPKEK